jgi:hypothetical protein
MWFLSSIDNGYEIVLAGDEQQPNTTRLRVAQAVTARLPELMPQVITHLDANLDYGKLGNSGQWHLEGVEFGRDDSHAADVFEVLLTTDEFGGWEDCELWFITCAIAESGFEVRGQRGGWSGNQLNRRTGGNA